MYFFLLYFFHIHLRSDFKLSPFIILGWVFSSGLSTYVNMLWSISSSPSPSLWPKRKKGKSSCVFLCWEINGDRLSQWMLLISVQLTWTFSVKHGKKKATAWLQLWQVFVCHFLWKRPYFRFLGLPVGSIWQHIMFVWCFSIPPEAAFRLCLSFLLRRFWLKELTVTSCFNVQIVK